MRKDVQKKTEREKNHLVPTSCDIVTSRFFAIFNWFDNISCSAPTIFMPISGFHEAVRRQICCICSPQELLLELARNKECSFYPL